VKPPPQTPSEDIHDPIDPTEEVGPEESEASATECEVLPGALDEPPEGCQVPILEEVYEPYVPETIQLVPSPIDGLPVPAGESLELQTAPAYTHENVVCMEDARVWVEDRDPHDRKYKEVYPRSAYDDEGAPVPLLQFHPDRVKRLYGSTFVELTTEDAELFYKNTLGNKAKSGVNLLRVRPRRPRCEHFQQQLFNIDGVADMRIMFTNCSAKRSVGGAMMSLRDQAVFACTLRTPRDPVSEKLIEEFDAKRLNANVERVPLVNIKPKPAEDLGADAGGIFSQKG